MLSNVDTAVSDCEKEPIHIPGSIQPHGILVTLRSSDLTILQVSESVFDLVAIHPSELLHQPLSRLMPTGPVERATKRLGDRVPRLLNPIPIEIEVNDRVLRFDGILHRSGRVLILELEKHVDEERGYGGFGGFYETIREVTSKMMVTENLSEVLELACLEIKKLTGFERVMVYRFDDDWNGEVVNEAKDHDVDSFLNHRFPASDIPKQARDLYTSNWLRLIPQVDYKPSPIIPPINPITDKPLDLSNSVLRSVSPVHIEYMKNMGIGASMSVSLLKGKKLWGLVACHDRNPRFLKYDVRVATEFIGQMVSAQIIAREDAASLDHKLQLKKLFDGLLKFGGDYTSITNSFSSLSTILLGLVDANGAALRFNREIKTIGITPPFEQIEKLLKWAQEKKSSLVSSRNVRSEDPELSDISLVAAGVLIIKLEQDGDALIWFRREVREGVKWAGNPMEAKILSQDGKLRPRRSFETWHETYAGLAKNWSEMDLEAVAELARALKTLKVTSRIPKVYEGKAEFRNSLTMAVETTHALKMQDSTELSQVDRDELIESAKSNRLLLEGFSEFAVLFLNMQGRIQNWSAGAKRLLGYATSDVLGKDLNLFFSEQMILTGKHEQVLNYVRTHRRCEEEMWLYRADRTSFWGKIMVAQICDHAQNMIGFSAVVLDVTKEKAAEEELKATKLSAEAANRTKSAFLANMSHEIRTPLGAILGFAELMSAPGITDKEKAQLYFRVKRNGEQLTVLINDLLDISKVESGKVDIERIPFSLEQLLYDCEQAVSLKAEEKAISFKFSSLNSLPSTVVTDPTRLRQILINLLSNAVKFTSTGGRVEVFFCIEELQEYGTTLKFQVKDSGRGMSVAEIRKVFKPFEQADASTTRNYGGTGLGLFLSQRLARALGGDLYIEWSEPGKGSCFTGFVQLGKVEGVETFSIRDFGTTVQHVITPFKTFDLSGARVLVVDDAEDNRMLFKIFLEAAKIKVTMALNGQEAVSKALTGDYDVVLMDIQMPVMDGNQAMQQLRERGYKVPVIALTAHAMREEKELSMANGFADYVTKPVDRKLLLEKIQDILNEKNNAHH
jgi:PAS domain S-box-containing protein